MSNYFQTKKLWLSENWPALLAVLVLGLLPFLPVLFSGQNLFASDQLGSPGWKFYFDALRKGVLTLWNPFGLGGMPTFDAGFGDAAYPVFIIMGFVLPVTILITYMFVLHVLFAGLCAYYLVNRYFGLPRLLSVGLAAAYMLNTNYISHIHAGHTGKFYVMSWLPISLYFLLSSLKRGAHWRHGLGLCLTITAFLLTNHIQLTYFVLIGYFIVWAYKTALLIKEKQVGRTVLIAGRFWVPIFLGLGMAFFMFFPTKKWTENYGIRGSTEKMGYEHATSWSIHPEEAFSLIVPEFSGLNERYWGRNPFKLNSEYPGISVLFLGILGLVLFRRAKGGWFWLWGSVGLLAVIFGLGAHTFFFQLFYNLVPGIKNFRAPSMMLFWLATALVIMSADMLSRLTSPKRKISPEQTELWSKRLLQVGMGFAGFLLLIGLAPGAFFGAWDTVFGGAGEAMQNLGNRVNDQSAFAAGAIKNAILLGILVIGSRKWLIRDNDALRFGALFLAVTCVDLYWTNSSFIKPYDTQATLAKDEAVSFLQADTSAYRVFGIPGAYERWRMQYHGIETVDGFTDNEYRLFREYRAGDGNYQENPNLMAGLKQNPDGTVSGSVFLDLLNVKYLAFRDPRSGVLGLAANSSALPRAWFVPAWESLPQADVMPRMKEAGFNPRREALVSGAVDLPAQSQAPIPEAAASVTAAPTDTSTASKAAAQAMATPAAPVTAPAASVALQSKDYNHSQWTVKADKEGILVLSELWFPHWNVLVDGKKSELLRVDYAFRGVHVPAGEHTVSFAYHSPWLKLSFAVAVASLVLLVPFLFGLSFLGGKIEKPTGPATAVTAKS